MIRLLVGGATGSRAASLLGSAAVAVAGVVTVAVLASDLFLGGSPSPSGAKVAGTQVVRNDRPRPEPPDNTPPNPGDTRREAPRSFRVAGEMDGLWPGRADAELVVTVYNDQPFDMMVRRLAATVVGVEAAQAGCTVDDVTVTPFEGSLLVPAGGSSVERLPIAMRASAPDACQEATFSLAYSGSADGPA